MNLIFSWWKQCTFVIYCFCHSKIKVIALYQCVIFFIIWNRVVYCKLFLVLNRISLVRFAHLWDILVNTRNKFHISAHPWPQVGHWMMFLPHCDVLCASITEQTMEKWNLFVLIFKNTFDFKIFTEFSGGIFWALKKMNRVGWRDPWSIQIIYQATSLARDIAVRSVIGLPKSDHVSDVICASVL